MFLEENNTCTQFHTRNEDANKSVQSKMHFCMTIFPAICTENGWHLELYGCLSWNSSRPNCTEFDCVTCTRKEKEKFCSRTKSYALILFCAMHTHTHIHRVKNERTNVCVRVEKWGGKCEFTKCNLSILYSCWKFSTRFSGLVCGVSFFLLLSSSVVCVEFCVPGKTRLETR